MKEITKFTLKQLPKRERDDWEQSQLYSDGKQTEVVLYGISLDAQLRHQESYVLFVTYNSIFAETLHIYYLNKDFRKIDEWQISQDSAAVHNLQIVADNQVKFSFSKSDEWLLTVLEKPAFVSLKLPILSSFWRPFRFTFTPGYLQLVILKR